VKGSAAGTMTFEGGGTTLHFPASNDKVIIISAGKKLVFKNTTLIGFRLEHVQFNSATSKIFFGDGVVFELDQDLMVTSNLNFSGDVIFNGNGKSLGFQNQGSFSIYSGTTFFLKDCLVKGVKDFKTTAGVSATRLMCDRNAKLYLSSVRIMLEASWTFTSGTLGIFNDVSMTSTWATFSYKSGAPSTINSYSKLSFNQGMSFLYDSPAGANKLMLVDATSQLLFKNASFICGRFGMNLYQGNVLLQGSVLFNLSQALPKPGLSIDPRVNLIIPSGTNLSINGIIAHGFAPS
jgi:hypothetical protein